MILFSKNAFQNVWNCRIAMDRRVKLTSRRQENSRTEYPRNTVSFLPQQEEQPSQQWTRVADCSLSHVSPRQACAGASAATSHSSHRRWQCPVCGTALLGWAPLPVCLGLGPWAGSHWGLSGESCSHARHNRRASLPEGDGSICNEGSGLLQVGFRDRQWASPAAHCHQDTGIQALPSQIPVQRKGKKVTSLLLGSQSEMDHRRAQHWNKVIYNQEKGRKPLLLEAASHWSVQLHTAQKSNYTNTLCVRFPIKCVFQ